LIPRLSIPTVQVLSKAYDRPAVLAGGPFVTALQLLHDALERCHQTRLLVKIAQREIPNAPSRFLAYGVAGGLAHARVHLAKSRDGILARVLTEVWYAVDPDDVPEDVLPYVRQAADFVRSQDATLAPLRGRPSRQKQVKNRVRA